MRRRPAVLTLSVCLVLMASACGGGSGLSPDGRSLPASGQTGQPVAAAPALPDYRAKLPAEQRQRYELMDKYRTIDACGFVDPAAVNRFLSAPLYVGPTSLTGPVGCAFNLNPTKTPLGIDSFTVETGAILEPNRKPSEMIAGTGVYADRLGASCTLSVKSATGLLVGLRTSQAGQTQLFGPAVDVCGPIRGVITASLPRLRMATPPATGVMRSKGARLDPCTAIAGVLDKFPKATSLTAESQYQFTNTTQCQISLTGGSMLDEDNKATVGIRLVPDTDTLLYDDSYSSMRVLGVPGSEGINQYTKCNVEVRLGDDQPRIATTSWTTLKIFDVSEKDTEDLVDSVKVDGTDCATAERMAVAVTAAYKAIR
ncbi:hypothetical protein [Williamsia sp.]|uniref:hypothetical protein n=1 Tax=Williamsia sp. TaxID=1872085 RepID=UPI001A2B327B|nr:hypothetical protein [Williamsia sp.]MBJ7288533.1 hypothetical protein [Williamsia sp.]